MGFQGQPDGPNRPGGQAPSGWASVGGLYGFAAERRQLKAVHAGGQIVLADGHEHLRPL
jgi:hypothetical protein